MFVEKRDEWEKYSIEIKNMLVSELDNFNIKVDIQSRFKNFYSIYKKMVKKNLDFNNVLDVKAFRIISEDVASCYAALGAVHSTWKPVPGKFKDYISTPKINKYKSIHTSIIGPKKQRIEVQLRTDEMHEFAERGIASHWK